MIERIGSIIKDWQLQLSIAKTSDLFVKVIYLVLIWSTIKLLMIGDVVWGSDYFILLSDPFNGIDRLAMLLNIPAIRTYYLAIALPFLFLLVAGVLGFYNFFTRIAVWYLFVLLHFGNGAISTGGHHLLQQLLFFHIFFFRISDEKEGFVYSAGRLMHHLAHYSVWIQIAILYLVSGIWKLKGELWLDGEAMFLTLTFKEFGLPWIANSMDSNTWYLKVLTWIVLAYQLLFAVLIWIKPIRKPLLAIGALFHLSIIFIIGITDFGLFMIASYSIFLTNETSGKMLNVLRLNSRSVV